MTRIRLLLGAVLVAVLLAGCGGSKRAEPPKDQIPIIKDGPKAAGSGGGAGKDKGKPPPSSAAN